MVMVAPLLNGWMNGTTIVAVLVLACLLEKMEEIKFVVKEEISGVKGEISGVKDILYRTSPKALLFDLIAPQLVLFGDDMKRGIATAGSGCTWTYVKRGGKYYALSAKHCLLQYSTTEFDKITGRRQEAFATMPAILYRSGIERVGFAGVGGDDDDDSGSGYYRGGDFAIVELAEVPRSYGYGTTQVDLSRILEYPNIVDDKLEVLESSCIYQSVVGLGVSAPVVGDGIFVNSETFVDAPELLVEFYVTLKVAGESGNSGTLMYATETCGTLTKHQPFGVYCGFDPNHNPGRRHRMVIAPLPRFETILWREVADMTLDSGDCQPSITISECNETAGKIEKTTFTHELKRVPISDPCRHFTFQHNRGTRFGVFLKEKEKTAFYTSCPPPNRHYGTSSSNGVNGEDFILDEALEADYHQGFASGGCPDGLCRVNDYF